MLGEAISMLVPQVVGFRLTGALPGGRDGDGPRPHGDADPARDRRRREVRRVLRARPRDASARRPRDDREHVARVRSDVRLLPRRRRDAALPPPHRPLGRADRARRGVLQGERALARPGRAADVLAGRRARPLHRRAVARRAAPAAGPRAAARGEAARSSTRCRPSASTTATRTTRPSPRRSRPATRSRPRARGSEPETADAEVGRPGRASSLAERPAVRGARYDGETLPARARRRRDRRDHVVHEHVEPGRHGRRRAAREEGRRARPRAQAVGEVEPRARARRSSPSTTTRPGSRRTSRSSASTRSATAARRASGTPARCPRRSREASPRATSSSARSSPETGTSRRASTRR